jgi:hypothetical protein
METIKSAIIIIKQNRKWKWIVTVGKRARNTGLSGIQNGRKLPGCSENAADTTFSLTLESYYLSTNLRIISIHFTLLRYKLSNLSKIMSINIKKNRREINNGQSSGAGINWQRLQNDEKQEKIEKRKAKN